MSPRSPWVDSGSGAPAARREDFDSRLADALALPSAGKAFPGRAIPVRAINVPLVSELPLRPEDSDRVDFQDPLTNLIWPLRYVAALPGAYKWVVVGHAGPIMAETTGAETTASTTYANLSGGATGPSITLPLAGFWDVEIFAQHLNSVANNIDIASYDIAGVGAQDADAASGVSTTNVGTTDIWMGRRKLIATTNAVLIAKYKYANTGGAGTATFQNRRIQATPLQVG